MPPFIADGPARCHRPPVGTGPGPQVPLPAGRGYRDTPGSSGRRLDGGLAYTPESLRRIFAGLTEVELRRMRDEPPHSPYFGEPFLWTALFRRPLIPSWPAP